MYTKSKVFTLPTLLFFGLSGICHNALGSQPFYCCSQEEDPRPQHRVTAKTTTTIEEVEERIRKNSREHSIKTEITFKTLSEKEEENKKPTKYKKTKTD